MKDTSNDFFKLFRMLAVIVPLWGLGCAEEPKLSTEEACDQGDRIQCGILITKSKPEVAKMESACERGEAAQCEELAALYWTGGSTVGQSKLENRIIVRKLKSKPGITLRVGQNKRKSKELYLKACQAGQVSACMTMAQASILVDHNQAGAMQYYAMACDLGEEEGCYWVDQAERDYPDLKKQRAEDEAFAAMMEDQQKRNNKPGRLRFRLRGR